jgi:hypothetical protein
MELNMLKNKLIFVIGLGFLFLSQAMNAEDNTPKEAADQQNALNLDESAVESFHGGAHYLYPYAQDCLIDGMYPDWLGYGDTWGRGNGRPNPFSHHGHHHGIRR